MNNVVVFLVDSVFSECIGNRKTEQSSTPFLDRLAREGIYAPNMYSFGPYTNAATKGLFCSEPTLDDYGYFFGINTAESNHYKAFKDNGYETFGFYYPYYLISNNTKQYIDNTIYTSGFIYSAIWNGNYKYYSEIRKLRELDKTEKILLYKFTEMLLELWIEYYDESINNAQSYLLISSFSSIQDMIASQSKIKEEYNRFKYDSESYINDILDNGLSHNLAKIDCVKIKEIPNLSFIRDYVYKTHLETIEYIENQTKKLNKKNNPVDVKACIGNIFKYIKTKDKNTLRYIYNQHMRLHTQRKMVKDTFNGVWQEHPSAKKQITVGLDLLKNRQSSKPFYMFFHFLEVHERLAYFSYDIDDKQIIDDEYAKAKILAHNCGEKFSGSIIYQLSLQYIDSIIQDFYNSLMQLNLLDNTTIMIIADHGSSYTYFPVRENVTNNFFKENYNIPMIIWAKNMPYSGKFDGLFTSMDAYPTLLSVCDLKIPKSFKGKCICDIPCGREYVITEYMGPGAPDMLTKSAWISIRNQKYLLAFKCPMNSYFKNEDMVEAYNIQNDSLQLHNIANELDINDEEIKFLIEMVKKRFDEICSNRDMFIKNIDNRII